MQNNEPIKESIWADGVPTNVDPKFVLQVPELLLMAVDFVVKNIVVPSGYKLTQAIADPKKLPNIICVKDEKIYSIAVVPFVYPNFAFLKDDIRIDFYNKAVENKTVPLFAPVGFASIDDAKAKVGLALKGDVFKTLFKGFVELTNDEKQDFIENPTYIKI